jgi:hypothetical protein
MKDKKIKRILVHERQYKVENGKFRFLEKVDFSENSDKKNFVMKIQNSLKRNGSLYYQLIQWLSPVLSSIKHRKMLNVLLRQYGPEQVIVNLGSGPRHLKGRKDIVNVDIFSFHEVDIIADAADLPFKDDSIDLLINTALLEHTSEPLKIIKDMHRVLRKGGTIFCFVPFIQPLHAAPDDFYRWTEQGIYESFSEFDELQVYMAGGPMSGFLWVFVEWISILLSFGSSLLHDVFFLIFMVLTSPLKILDVLMIKLPYARNIASGFGIVAKKPNCIKDF